MFVRVILLVVSLSFLLGFHEVVCDGSCADQPVFTPSTLVLEYGDPASATCSVCQHACLGSTFGLETSTGTSKTNGTTISWTVYSMNEWDTSALCYYNKKNDSGQCFTTLPVTVYQPPENVSLSFVNHTGPMFEGQQYTLQCTVQEVAPVENLTVTFYRGQTALGRLQSTSSNSEKTPVTEVFTLDVSASKEHDGVQFWCQAELQLGPEGPPSPPVVRSPDISAAVYYKPQLKASSHLELITVTEGDRLQLDCSAVGNPRPSYTWMFPSDRLRPPIARILVFTSVTSADGGQYSCSATNDVGTVTVRFRVVVRGLQLTSTRSPPTTTTTTRVTTTATTTRVTTTKTTTTTSTTGASTAAPTSTQTTTVLNCSTSSKPIHRFIMCFMFLFSALV